MLLIIRVGPENVLPNKGDGSSQTNKYLFFISIILVLYINGETDGRKSGLFKARLSKEHNSDIKRLMQNVI